MIATLTAALSVLRGVAFADDAPTVKYGGSICLLSTDGAELLEVYSGGGIPSWCGPKISPDQSRILFDVCPTRKVDDSRITVIDADGANRRELCRGHLADWSPDGGKFVCTRQDGRLWIMQADGEPLQEIDQGLGGTWSPDGTLIAYRRIARPPRNGPRDEIWLYDVASETSHPLLTAGGHSYGSIGRRFAWTPNGRRLYFVGGAEKILPSQIASVAVTGDDRDLQVLHTNASEVIESELAFSPDGSQLYFSVWSMRDGRRLVHRISPAGDTPPEVVPGQNTGGSTSTSSITTDGKWIVLSVER